MGLAFELTERLSGGFHLLADPLRDRALTLTLRVVVDELRPLGAGFRGHATGRVAAEGVAEDAEVEGVVEMRFARERRQIYDLRFRGDDGEVVRLRGQKDFLLHSGLDALTVVAAGLFDAEGEEMGRAVLRFDARADLDSMARSLRVRLGSRWLGRRSLSLGASAPRLTLSPYGGDR